MMGSLKKLSKTTAYRKRGGEGQENEGGREEGERRETERERDQNTDICLGEMEYSVLSYNTLYFPVNLMDFAGTVQSSCRKNEF